MRHNEFGFDGAGTKDADGQGVMLGAFSWFGQERYSEVQRRGGPKFVLNLIESGWSPCISTVAIKVTLSLTVTILCWTSILQGFFVVLGDV